MAKPTPVTVQARTAAHRRALLLASVLLIGVGALIAAGAARAQLLNRLVPQLVPVTVEASGDTATVEVKLLNQELADLTLSFDDASGLSASSLGVTAELLDPNATSLLSRLPDLQLNQLTGALPLLVTIEPPANGGLSFDRTVRVEIHTHLLSYAPGSSYRLFKAELGGEFRVFVNVQLGDLHLAGHLRGDFLERGRNHLARAAPFGPEIHHDRLGGIQDFGLEIGRIDFNGSHEGLLLDGMISCASCDAGRRSFQ